MSQHLHAEYVDGCYRCELSRDDSIIDAVLAVIDEQIDLLVERKVSSLRYAKLRHGYALVREDPGAS